MDTIILELTKQQLATITNAVSGERETTGGFMDDRHNDEGLQEYYRELQDAEFVLTEASK